MFKESDLQALNEAIATGELSVKYNGRETTFRSISELILAKEHVQKELDAARGRRRPFAAVVKVRQRL